MAMCDASSIYTNADCILMAGATDYVKRNRFFEAYRFALYVSHLHLWKLLIVWDGPSPGKLMFHAGLLQVAWEERPCRSEPSRIASASLARCCITSIASHPSLSSAPTYR